MHPLRLEPFAAFVSLLLYLYSFILNHIASAKHSSSPETVFSPCSTRRVPFARMADAVLLPTAHLRRQMHPSINDAADVYRLFGDLVLDRPENCLDQPALRRLKQLERHIHGLLQRRHYSTGATLTDDRFTIVDIFANIPCEEWKYHEEFEAAALQEVAHWGDMGVTRPKEFLVPPEGPQDATVPLHLHNPTISVKTPWSQSTCDPSDFSICQITQIGFSTENCLWYDHLFRREALDGLKHYPAEILKIHEIFSSNLRKHMSAVVEICWGSCVKKRMKQTLCLEPLRLWVEFEQVTIWLEWEVALLASKIPKHELKRFAVFVMHPQAMLVASRPGQVRLQDQHLAVAARLGGLRINEQFFETSHRPGSYGRLLKVE